ncbi:MULTISPECIES: hypothetical protein [Pseudonocardia]|uniref:Uncharacterized protein n=2 Tax=Pseudonocardia TaxID=1847 RepID=A0A1Y2N9G4_PSEAH|nr:MULTISPECIES: hypothetical protein [Pseudonocardia]OSY43548.1 hypothetical protein BG845_00491 [Pseudonocardia autotrophica]TDN73461.1 hypothetical protein C8E95_2558 [Pseudonocardia autotrophica]BBG04201.1 hypothetical protein Pdca_54100 [Pseudonocardia autotrophica]GEC25532.1 hypothetical protein PSA01_25610 [Pseudonocardia saturnea]
MSDRQHTTDGPDDGTDVGTGELTSGGAGTVREERDHAGNPRSGAGTDDSGVTDAAAHEVTDDDEDEPTRSE